MHDEYIRVTNINKTEELDKSKYGEKKRCVCINLQWSTNQS